MPEPSLKPRISPGTYLKLCREAARLEIGDVARSVETEPRLAEHLRVELIELIEADVQPLSFSTVVALRIAFRFDMEVLFALALGDLLNIPGPLPRLCRSCACSENSPCAVPAGGADEIGFIPCHWVERDLCSRCAPSLEAAA